MITAQAKPYPWAALDATSRAEVSALRALRDWSAGRVRADDVARTVSSLLDARVEVRVRRAGPFAGAPALDGGVAVVLATGDAARLERGLVVEADGALATAMIAHAVRRPVAAIVDASKKPTPGIAGAFAAIVAATARRAHDGAALRVLAAGPSNAIVRDVARLHSDLIAVDLTVLLDDDAHLARVLLPRGAALVASSPRWDAARLASMGDVDLALGIVACASTASATEIALLAPGDAWVPGAWPLVRAPSGAWSGPVRLAAPTLDFGIAADLVDDGRLVLRGEVKQLGWAPDAGASMDDSNDTNALIEAVGEVPVVVRVEIGTAQMRARDWAALSKGDVVALGRRIADPVILRVGGIEVARGELVELEGEVAVRIVDRFDGKETRS